MTWRPLSTRGSDELREAYDGPHEGIPASLRSSVVGWMGDAIGVLRRHYGTLES
jgi:hypothetical protein